MQQNYKSCNAKGGIKMNATTELVFKKKLYFPTKCVGVGRDVYAEFTPAEVSERVRTTLNDIKDFANWAKD